MKNKRKKQRDQIDKLLEQAGWFAVDMKSLTYSDGRGVASGEIKPLQFDDIENGKFDAIIERTKITSRKGSDYGTLIR